MEALRVIAAHCSQTKRQEMATLFPPALNDAKLSVKQAAAQLLSALVGDLTDEQLQTIIGLTDVSDEQILTLQLIAQTRLQIKYPQWNPGLQLEVCFSSENNEVISQHLYNLQTKTSNPLRTFRLWSKANATDDCMTEMRNAGKPRFKEV